MIGITHTVLKPSRFIPLQFSKRWKVRNLPTENYEEYESKSRVSTRAVDLFSVLHRQNLTWAHFKHWYKWKVIKDMQKDQKYIPDRHNSLGPDLATTHFITARDGKVRFVGNDTWITYQHIKKKIVPSFYVPGFFIEEIDASGLELCYEGFDNLGNLSRLKKLNISNCPYIDDWCLSRNHLFSNTLEYLDISGCHQVTDRGICTLHSLKKLKTLVINDTPNIQNKELVSLMLLDVIPDCNIIGVDYKDPSLLKRIEHLMH